MKFTFEEEALLRRMRQECEQNADYELPIIAPLDALMSLVSCLQLSLRHPDNTGSTAETVRGIVDSIIARVEEDGMPAVAEGLRKGNGAPYERLRRT